LTRVLFVSKPIAPPWHDGSKNLVRDVASHLVEARATVMATPGAEPIGPRVTMDPVYRDAGRFAPGLVANARVLDRLVRGDPHDAWHFVFAPNPASSTAGRVARAARRLRGWRGAVIQTVASAPRSFDWARHLLFGDTVVALSEWTRARLVRGGADPARVVVIPPCARAPAEPSEDARRAARAALGLGPAPLLLYPGDYEVSRGADTVARAVASIARAVPEARVVFACRPKTPRAGAARAAVEATLREANVASYTHHAGELADLAPLLAASSAVLFPVDDLYGKVDLPLVLLEALALGVPLVLARGGPLEAIDAARFVDAGDAEALAREAIALLRGGADRAALVRAGREAHRRAYAPDVVAARYEELYLGRPRAAASFAPPPASTPGKSPSTTMSTSDGVSPPPEKPTSHDPKEPAASPAAHDPKEPAASHDGPVASAPPARATTASDVRAAFLGFFRRKGHEVVPSAPLVPANDPTLMFSNAGMVQFKDVFTGKEERPYSRATSSQKCIRISGKHNDLENVGVTARHHTFFEMLGNFSFGDYFKEDAIAYAWELLTKVFGLPEDHLVITVFGGEQGIAADDEARAIWRKVTGFPDAKIIGMGMKDNFWQMGDAGPCGPCSEIHYFQGGGAPDLGLFDREPGPDGRGWMEIWNLVFMQFDRSIDGGAPRLDPLPAPCVDTGAGLERVASVLQGKVSNYETDLLRALVDKASEISGKTYRASAGDDDVSMRVIADHARTTAFLIAEGVFPDRAGREYVLRRVMRRAIRHGHRLGISQPFLHEVALEVVRLMGDHYPELVARKGLIASTAEQEEVRFRQTIDRGLKILDEEIGELRRGGHATISGDTAFKLYDTYGFPLDLTEVIAKERDLDVDTAGYERALDEQRARSEGSKVGEAAVLGVWRDVAARVKDGVRFVGYEREEAEGAALAIVKGDAIVERATAGEEVAIVTDVTPFYGEAGGQVGDRGTLRSASAAADLVVAIDDTQKPLAGLFVHYGRVVSGTLETGAAVRLEVDHERRSATRRNHSATHLLHWALRSVIGEQATQKGSLVGPDRLRFDFSHGKPLAPEEIAKIEDLVNAKVLVNAPVETEVLPIDEARKKGAVAIFEEKYGDVVRVLTMTKDSVELCGGTHARALGEIGLFKIVSEGGVAAGVRRIEAATGLNALAYVRQVERTLKSAAQVVKSGPSDLPDRLEKLLDKDRALEKEVADLKRKLAFGGGGGGGGVDDLVRGAREIPGGKALAVKVDAPDAATLRELAEQLRDKLGEAVVLVGAVQGPKAALALAVSKSLVGRYKAGDLIKGVAQKIGGSGGGRPDMAQAGGADTAKLDEALASLYASFPS